MNRSVVRGPSVVIGLSFMGESCCVYAEPQGEVIEKGLFLLGCYLGGFFLFYPKEEQPLREQPILVRTYYQEYFLLYMILSYYLDLWSVIK